MHRRTAAAIAAIVALGVAAPGALATARPTEYDANGQTLNILPPGSNGNATAQDAIQYELTGDHPSNFADQLEMYDKLNTVVPGSLRDGDLPSFYKDARLGGDPRDVVSTETPVSGVTIKRDSAGVPHIDGKTAEDVAYGAGYAGIEDRMFLTDILRHTGAANMAAFVGPDPGNIARDQEQLRIAPYTPAEAAAQVAKVAQRYPKEGPALLKRLDAFIAGMNAAQHKLCPGAFGLPVPGANGAGFGPDCPAEYAALQKAPADYTRADIVYIASLVGGIFGKGGGNEYADALWFEALQSKFGTARARRMYDDLREKNDPEAFTSASTPFPYLLGGIDPTKAGVAMPVPGAPVASGTGSDAGGSGAPVPAIPVPGTAAYQRWQQQVGIVHSKLGTFDLGLQPRHMSNALLVDARHSKNGHPVAVFGPQTGYFTPQLLTEVDLHGPGIAARGVSFAGTQLVVELGHGVDYAWSATSASGDVVDTVFERLCNADGSAPTVNSTSYVGGSGRCVPIDTYVHDEGVAMPNAAAQAPPQPVRLTVMRTRHGIVQFRTMARDRAGREVPVAVVTERSTYGHEVDSVLGFARVNDPDYVHGAKDFSHAFDGVDYTFNWFYADAKDIAYKVSGLLPLRPATVDSDLPRWGDAAYDWKGWLSPAAHAHQANPPSGFLASWNNKQAPQWGMADDEWGHSAVHRVNLLVERIRALIAHGRRITRAQLVGAMIDAATTDLRGEQLLPLALQVVGDDPKAVRAIALLKKWVADGAHRVDRKRTGAYDDQAAIALFDTWWDDNGKGDGGLARDTLRPTLGDLVTQLPGITDDHPRQGVGSSWDSVPYYGYVSRVLRAVLGRHVVGPYSAAYCGSLAICRAVLRASLEQAIDRATGGKGDAAVDSLTYDKTNDDIVSRTAGIVAVRPIDWQNRPTFQQVVNFTAHRK